MKGFDMQIGNTHPTKLTLHCDIWQVCGEDGVTYQSIRDMVVSNCEKGLPPNQQVNIDYYGRCKCKSRNTCIEK